MTVVVLDDLVEDASVAAGVQLGRHGTTVNDGWDAYGWSRADEVEVASCGHVGQ